MPQSRLHGRIPECTARQTLNRNTKKGYRKTRFEFSVPFLHLSRRMNAVVCRREIFCFPSPASDREFPGIGNRPTAAPKIFTVGQSRRTPPSLPVAATPGRILHKTRFLSCLHARQSTLYRATPAGESGFFTVLAGKRFSFSGNVITLCSHPMVTESLRKSRSPFPGISAMDSDPFQSSSPSNTNAADPVMSTRSAV